MNRSKHHTGRRDLLALGGLAGAGTALAGLGCSEPATPDPSVRADLLIQGAWVYTMADLVMLGADPHETDPDGIKQIPVLRTLVGGNTVHEA